MRINFSTVRELLGGEKLVKLCGDREPAAAVVNLTLRGAYNNESPPAPQDCHATAMTGCRRTPVHIDCRTERSLGYALEMDDTVQDFEVNAVQA